MQKLQAEAEAEAMQDGQQTGTTLPAKRRSIKEARSVTFRCLL